MEPSVIMWGVGKVVVISLIVGAPIRVLVIIMRKALVTYVTKEAHTSLCQIASLEMKLHVTEVIDAAKKEILEAIKSNGGK